MNVIILAGGYGTRLQREVVDNINVYGHLLDVPKPLLPIGGVPLIARWIHLLQDTEEVKQVLVLTNGKYRKQFEQWSEEFDGFVTLYCDGTMKNEERSGSNGAIEFVLKKSRITNEDILVIAGDTLFTDDFNIDDFLVEFYKHKVDGKETILVTSYRCKEEETVKHGILEINEDNLVTNFMEKPKPSETKSRQACPCFYAMSSSSLHNIFDFLASKINEPIEAKDATGHFIKYLITRAEVHSYLIPSRFDVGGLESYLKCNEYFTKS